MNTFTFYSDGNYFHLQVANDVIVFSPKDDKAKKALGKDFSKKTIFSLQQPEEISKWITNISTKLGPTETVLEIFKLKYQYLEDLIESKLKYQAIYSAVYNPLETLKDEELDEYFSNETPSKYFLD